MGLYEFAPYFGGLPVADLRPSTSEATSIEPGTQPSRNYGEPEVYGVGPAEYAADAIAWRIRIDPWEDDELTFEDHFRYFLDSVDTTRVTALLCGCWDEELSEESPALALLVENAAKFPNLRHLFLGDVVQEESEISWMTIGHLTPVLRAFPQLEELVVRGGDEAGDPPALEPLRHEGLRKLTFESGGLSARVITTLGLCEFPALESLDVWMGISEYGGDATADDLAELLSGVRLPALRHLGLMNSEIQDAVAAAVAGAPLTARLESLDLSMGTLGDEGAEALLAGQPLTHLKRLRINHHFISDPTSERLRKTLRPLGVTVDIDSPEQLRDWGSGRYAEVTE
ncbi:STM4015 family protein [Uniformispora flossi]|uniref:STM4015 family protein n=1 Tax=Uniformispora flossi TaxID=3390723 RepID=UPI003C2D1949